MVHSMTGYARQEAIHSWGVLTFEIRSVNHRYLEPQFRLPELVRPLEISLRNLLRKNLHRGKVDVALHLRLEEESNDRLKLNLDVVQQLQQATQDITSVIPNATAPDTLGILNWPGVIDTTEIDNDTLQNAALELFEQCLQQLIQHRQREGKELTVLIEQRLDSVSHEVERLRPLIPTILQTQKDKLLARFNDIQGELNQDRLEQEIIFYAQKIDVDEELDRLQTHVTEVRRTLQQKGPIGRRLDFLMQELNREANTLSSKSITTDTTQGAVELKILIEQMREQIQNIE